VPTAKSIRIAVVLLAAVALPALAAKAITHEHSAPRVVRAAPPAAPAPPRTSSYGWPVKPFRRQHPVRGMFGDPRIGPAADGGVSRQFHFGIDISAPNGTPVYATLTGTVVLDRPGVVAIVTGPHVFSYWHIAPTVKTGDHVVAYRTLIGRIERPWAHVHFSEKVDGAYLNPLRPGALGPYADATRPAVTAIRAVLDRSGRLDLIADVEDGTPLAVPRPWADKPVMPELVRWRVLGRGPAATGWKTALDVRRTIPDRSRFFDVYTTDTRQNLASVRGRYGLYLAHSLDPHPFAAARYEIEVVASDGHGNEARAVARVTMSDP
jgi:hypothetical protein